MFFEVKAKCGHVGRNKYIIKDFYVQADSAKKAAYDVRYAPRVKHNHKDAIKLVRKISYEEYLEGINKNKNDLYFCIHNSSEQKRLELDLVTYDEEQDNNVKKEKNSYFRLRKRKIIEIEYRRMVDIAYYG